MPVNPQEESPKTASLRLALILGFGGMLFIFTIAAVDALRLLREMREENKILRDASLDRSRRLSSIRTYTSLCAKPDHDIAEMRRMWSRASASLDGYPASTREEASSLKRLGELLRGAAPSGDEVVVLRATIVEIDSSVEDVDARQRSAAENQIGDQFEILGKRLSQVLVIALCVALLLAAGCAAYILRIERLNSRRYQEILNASRSLEQLPARLLAAQESERRAISRELHDEVGQTLGAVLVDAANLAVRIPADDAVSHRYLDNIRALADTSVNSIRNIALLLRPSMLDDLGLIPALEWQAREVSRRSGIKVKVSAHDVSDSLLDAVRT
jgi:signal transduction histidine kinase